MKKRFLMIMIIIIGCVVLLGCGSSSARNLDGFENAFRKEGFDMLPDPPARGEPKVGDTWTRSSSFLTINRTGQGFSQRPTVTIYEFENVDLAKQFYEEQQNAAINGRFVLRSIYGPARDFFITINTN